MILFQLFVYSSGAQSVLSYGVASSAPGRALASGVGLGLAVYCGFNASGNILMTFAVRCIITIPMSRH